MTFKRRLSLSIVALILALVTILSVAYLRYLLGIEMQFAMRQAETLAEQVRGAIQDTLSGREFNPDIVKQNPQMPEILGRLLWTSRLIAEIAVTDERGRVLAASPTMEREWWMDKPGVRALVEKNFLTQLRTLYAPQRDYEVSRALGLENKPVLVVHVVVSTALLRDELDPQIRSVVRWALAGLSASLLLAIIFSRIVFRPLDRLGEAIDRMTRGEFAPVAPEPGPKRDEYTAITSKLSLLGQQFRDAREGITSLRSNMEQLMRKLEGAVLLFDADDRLIIASSGSDTFLDRGRWQVMGQSIEDIFPAGSELGALVASAARLRQPITDRIVEIAAAEDGSAEATRILLSVELIEDFATRRRLGTLVTLRDAETRRQIETQVEVSSRLAAISRLTGGVAHEIKNPLNAITLHLELLKNRLSKTRVDSPELDIIVREVTRLDRVVKTFLDFTRPVDLRLSDVRLDALLDEVATLAGPEASQHNVKIHIGNGCPESIVRADHDLLKQAVLNLAVNGIQAMPKGGELTLSLQRLGSEIELCVADQGVGIPPENRDKIFRLYFTTRQNGSGIGLAMTFRVVQLHNGTIEFSSEQGRGTTFRVRIPALEGR